MLTRRAAVAAAMAFVATSASGQTNLDRYLPLLVDLPGWSADKPELMAMTSTGHNFFYITREYQRGSSLIMVMAGRHGHAASPGMSVPPQNLPSGTTTFTSGTQRVESKAIRGFVVHTMFDTEDNSGMVTVELQNSQIAPGMLTLVFERLTVDEALQLAQRFDWSAMQKMLNAR